MTTPSPDDARTPRRDEPTPDPTAHDADETADLRAGSFRSPAARRPERDDTSELESTATRRQGFMGLRGEAPTGADAGTPRGDADPHPEPGTRPEPGPHVARTPEEAALRERWREREASAGVLDGATQAAPRSRAGAHWWSLLLTLVLAPVAWYLVADAGARLTLGDDSPWARGELAPAALIELAAGLVVTAVVLLTARWSSLGAQVTGVLVLLAGLAFVILPARTAEVVEPAVTWLEDLNALGRNVAHHLLADGPAGRLALYGLGLLAVGVVSHGARRLGRAEERAREAYALRTGRSARHGNGR
ncbi:hypothetical protein KZX45_18555 [Georgenia sp. EYE_87]|uniref:hypothetical protein n=1 Tax=Georgenia sp. EYE_87 TaxID=2853448 RepID=UPI002003BAC6|nr:hypothetical protein [Georgenia sp. EYE_87]MCK6212542.1 hypothetical protein [Georgenia sp. EYE_87]